jgi:HK97 family phage major capsid protein
MGKYLELVGQAKAKVEAADALLKEFEGKDMPEEKGAEFDALMKEADGLKTQAERYKAVEDRDAELKTAEKNAPKDSGAGGKAGNEAPTFKHVYAMRFGDEPEVKVAVMRDLVGDDYRQFVWDQNAAYAKYLRYGDMGLDRDEAQLLKKQLFPWQQVEALLKAGMTIGQIKTTMVEAQGTLGGYAVPANVQAEIAARLPGLTAVRRGGARVITLTTGNSVDVPVYTGGTDQYRGAIRGAWGSETQTPTEKNATLGLTPLIAQVYTYKVPMSQSLVEDAGNLVDLVTSDITSVAAIDEDIAFLTGDGAGKPLGILPSSGNSLGFTEKVTGNGTALTADGIKALKRGLATQYRQNGRFIGNSDTYEAIEKLKDGGGAYIYGDLSETGRLLQREALESEALPDVAANAYPLIFADLSGYWVVERAGFTIVRFQDSNTGVNKVEYHVRRRLGGRPVEIWKFAVTKVAAA